MPSNTLSVSMRPRTLSGLYGQASTVAAIRQHIKTRPPRTWLFYGEPGSGKTTAARIMAVIIPVVHGPRVCGAEYVVIFQKVGVSAVKISMPNTALPTMILQLILWDFQYGTIATGV